MTEFINIADIINKETGKTYRQENESKSHNIPLGALVELDNGLRLFVVAHERDCDGTPLYSLSFDRNWSSDMYGKEFKMAARFRIDHGYSEESLKIILPF